MSNYISSIEQNGILYAIKDESNLNCVVLLNNQPYNSFEEALVAANGIVELKLLEDIILENPVFIPADADITLKLNGHSIKAASTVEFNGGLITILHGATLTVDGEGTIFGAVPGSSALYAPFQLTHKDYANDTKCARLIINGGHIIGHHYAICGNGNSGRGNTEIIINNGILECVSFSGTAIYNPQENSSITINGGTIIGGDTGIELRSGSLKIENGRIESLNSPASVSANGNGTTAVGSAVAVCQHSTKNPIDVVINGGIMRGYHALYQANPQENEAEAIELVNLTVNNGSFVAINSAIPVFSENKTHFIHGGIFSHPVNESYNA